MQQSTQSQTSSSPNSSKVQTHLVGCSKCRHACSSVQRCPSSRTAAAAAVCCTCCQCTSCSSWLVLQQQVCCCHFCQVSSGSWCLQDRGLAGNRGSGCFCCCLVCCWVVVCCLCCGCWRGFGGACGQYSRVCTQLRCEPLQIHRWQYVDTLCACGWGLVMM